MKKYDLIVIGFGKAGKTLASKYASLNKKVLLFEKDSKMYGGTCINIGCIPTKTMIVAAENNNEFKNVKSIKDTVVSTLNQKNFDMLNNNPNIEIINQEARFKSDKVIEADNIEYTADIIVINTGARSNILNIDGILTTKNVFDSTQIQNLETMPKNLGILGAGNIGLEFANLFSKMNSNVTVIDPLDKILPREDDIISELAFKYMSEKGINFKLNTITNKIYNKEDKVVLETNNGILEFDALLYATGRVPNIETLNLENTNIKVEKGHIVVDKYCQTSVKNIFAVGDVNGQQQFTYTSLDDFRIVFSYLTSTSSYTRLDRKNVPYSVFISPVLSRVGLNEKQAILENKNYITKELLVAAMPRGFVNNDKRGIFKVLVDKDTNLILGASLFSKNSEELINIIKMAMDNNIPYTYLKNQVFTHPTMAENLNDVFNI